MRIFLAINPSGNSSVPGSMTWVNNFYEPLIDLGIDVFLYRIDLAPIKASFGSRDYKDKFSQHVLETFKSEHKKKPFDLFFSYFIDKHIHAELIEQVKKKGMITTNFSCNNTHQFYLTSVIAPHFDYNLHSEKDANKKFEGIGAKSLWFSMGANPKKYKPYHLSREYDVSFVGGNYGKRSFYIRHLLNNGINAHCFGPNWRVNKPKPFLRHAVKEFRRYKDILKLLGSLNYERRSKLSASIALYDLNHYLRNTYKDYLHYPVSDEELVKFYSRSHISLGFLEVFDNNEANKMTKQHLHLREFEAPMSRALYFTNYCDELEEFYEPDKEVITYRNEHELLDKVRFFLKNPEKAEKIREAGYQRALACHTYQKRFEDLFKKLNIK